MAIRSPFKHRVPLSSEGQPTRPVLPVDSDNTYAADSSVATALDTDAKIYNTEQIDIPKATTSYSQAKSMASLVVDPRVERSMVSSLVKDKSFLVVSQQSDYVFSTTGHPGYGSVSARAEMYMIAGREFPFDCACLIDADNTVEAEASGVITTYPDRVEVSNDCSCYITNKTYEIVDFRWRNNDTSLGGFGNSCDSSGIAFTQTHYYELAIRVRVFLNKTESVGSSDWNLEFTTDPPRLNNWTSVFGASSITVAEQSWNSLDPSWPYNPVAKFVTTPGPGIIKQVDGLISQPSNESFPYYEAVAARNIESEVRYCLYLTGSPSIVGKPVYFRLKIDASEVPGATSKSMHPVIDDPWILIVV